MKNVEPHRPLIGCIADDFTGAADMGCMFSAGGLETVLVTDRTAVKDIPVRAQAVIAALKTRSVEPDIAVAQSLATLRWLLSLGCQRIVFKYCSTFDSTPRGNIGPVAEALAAALDVSGVIVCPAFPATGRTVYQGHLFVNDRLLERSGMENHPLNPMTESDLRIWLGRQTKSAIGHLPHSIVRQGPRPVREALHAASETCRLVVTDAICDDDLSTLGAACADARLVTGGSGIGKGLAQALSANASGKASLLPRFPGKGCILAGSCSEATLGQIEDHARNHPAMRIDIAALMSDRLKPDEAADFLLENGSENPILYSSQPAEMRNGDGHGAGDVAEALEAFFSRVAIRFVEAGGARLVVAGGETSGAVISALGLKTFLVGPEIDPGVPALISLDRKALGVSLKSGNFGSPSFFRKAMSILEGGDHGHRSA